MRSFNPVGKNETDAFFGVVMNGFLPHIRRRASVVRSAGIESDDIVQEGLIGLCDAIESFSDDGTASFRTYAITCIDNRINSALRAATRQKNLPMAEYTSFYDENVENELCPECSAEEIAVAREASGQ